MRARRFYLAAAMVFAAALATTAARAETVPSELVGQVVCSSCWSEADRTRIAYGTPADLDCFARCAEQGIPPALAVKGPDGDGFELIVLEGTRDWSTDVGRFVRLRGDLHMHDEQRAMLVESVALLDVSPWADPRAFEALAAGGAGDSAASSALSWVDLTGHRQSLERYRGRVVVLNFWATWCAPCIKEMPDLARIQRRYGMYGVQVLAAAADEVGDADRVARFADKRNVNFPVLLGANTEQMQSLGAGVALPATVVLDRSGRVVERISGVFERDELESLLDRVVFEGEQAAGKRGGRRVASAGHDHAGHSHGSGHPKPATEAALVPS